MMDLTKEEYEFTKKYLASIEYDDYDLLMHLCDNIALHSGYVLMEKRIIDIAIRNGVHEGTVERLKGLFKIKDYLKKRWARAYILFFPVLLKTHLNYKGTA